MEKSGHNKIIKHRNLDNYCKKLKSQKNTTVVTIAWCSFLHWLCPKI